MENRNLNSELIRLKTFDNWSIPFINKHTLALLGFYYCGPGDLVKCFCCKVEIGKWEDGDDVLNDHIKWSPSCVFIRYNNYTNNIPIDAEFLNQILPPSSSDVYSTVEQFANTITESFSLSKPKFPEYSIGERRIESYVDWPISIKQRPPQLSDAGFFYTGKGDCVTCFSCGGGLKDWEIDNDPWEEHAIWYRKCAYVNLVKGPDFVSRSVELRNKKNFSDAEVKSSIELKKSDSIEKLNEVVNLENETKDLKLCKICYVNEYNVVFMPCGHIIACAKCASSVTKCPVCCQSFKNIERVFFS